MGLLILLYVLNYCEKEKKPIAMILTCPNCNVQFNLDDDLLGESGRKVKCTSCEEIWFQDPEIIEEVIEEVDFEAAVQEEDLQEEGVFQEIEEPPPQTIQKPVNNIDNDKNKFISIAIAASVFLVIFTYLLVNSSSFIQNNPNMRVFYALFGVGPEVAGQNLVFDQVVAENNGKAIKISGNIINLESAPKQVPDIEISLIGGTDIVIAKWYINPPKDMVEPEGNVAFSSSYDIELPESERLNAKVRFVLGAKIDEASGADNPALHLGGSDHQSDHGESLKPHQAAVSEPHQGSSHH